MKTVTQDKRVYHKAPENGLGIFEFSLEIVLQQLEQCIQEYSDEEDKKLLKWLHYQWERMGFHVADIIKSGSFRVFCKKCGQHLSSSSVIQQEWSYDCGFLATGGGRRFLCEQGHELLKVQAPISGKNMEVSEK